MPRKQSSSTGNLSVPIQIIERRIYLVRGQKVMLDFDLADLYEVSTKALNQAVKRNPDRFPADFMFQLTPIESRSFPVRSQIVTASKRNIRFQPYAFTEHGIAMLSSVLRSKSILRSCERLSKCAKCWNQTRNCIGNSPQSLESLASMTSISK